jgi:hypothetical protein
MFAVLEDRRICRAMIDPQRSLPQAAKGLENPIASIVPYHYVEGRIENFIQSFGADIRKLLQPVDSTALSSISSSSSLSNLCNNLFDIESALWLLLSHGPK